MSEKTIHSVGIIMNGVTGRMGLNQHLRRSIYAIMQQGGVKLGPSEVIMPKPFCWAAMPPNSRRSAPSAAASAGAPTWTRNSPTPNTYLFRFRPPTAARPM